MQIVQCFAHYLEQTYMHIDIEQTYMHIDEACCAGNRPFKELWKEQDET